MTPRYKSPHDYLLWNYTTWTSRCYRYNVLAKYLLGIFKCSCIVFIFHCYICYYRQNVSTKYPLAFFRCPIFCLKGLSYALIIMLFFFLCLFLLNWTIYFHYFIQQLNSQSLDGIITWLIKTHIHYATIPKV